MAEGLSRLAYTAMVLEALQPVIKKVNTALFTFIWKSGPHYLNRNVLCNLFNQGGLNAIDF